MKKVILFAGLHKTGSTSIQRTCVLNQQVLAEQGIHYFPELLPDGRFGNRGSGNHTRLLRIVVRDAPQHLYEREHLREYREAAAGIRATAKRLLAGREDTILMVAEVVSAFSAGELARLREWFLDCGAAVQLVCCVRKPSEWLSSMVAQRVAGVGGPRLTIDAAVNAFVEAGGVVVPRIRALGDVFPDTDFFSFAAALRHPGGPVGFFLERIGLKLPPEMRMVRANDGKSAPVVRLQSRINGFVGPRGASSKQDAFYLRFPDEYPRLASLPGEKFALWAAEAAPLIATLEAENRWLEAHFGDGFHDEAHRFGDGPLRLEAGIRHLLEEELASAKPPVKQVIAEFLADH